MSAVDCYSAQLRKSWMPVQYVSSNIGPELAKDIGQGIPSHRPSVFHGKVAGGPDAGRVVCCRNSLRDPAAKNF